MTNDTCNHAGQEEAYKLGGLDDTLTATDAEDQAGFYILGDQVEENGLATEFCAIGKVNTEGASNANVIIGRVLFFIFRGSAAEEDTEADNTEEVVQEYDSIVGRVTVTYMTSRDLLQANGMIVRNCSSGEIEVEEGDHVAVFIEGACIPRTPRRITCPLQVNFNVEGDYGVEFFNGSGSPLDVESDILQDQLISIDDTFLNVEITIEPGMIIIIHSHQ